MDSPIDIEALLKEESASVEWKENVADVEAVVRKLTAYANNYTGTIPEGWVVCGVREEKDEHGFQRAEPVGLTAPAFKKIRGEVLSLCWQKVSPPLVPQIYPLPAAEEPSRQILVFYVAASPYAHSFRGRDKSERYWIQSDSRTIEARGELLRELLRRKKQVPPFLEQPCPEASTDAIQRIAAEEFLREADLPLPTEEYLKPGVTMEAIASPLVVSRPEAPGADVAVPTYLALLLFAREPASYLPGAYLVFSVYDGTSRTARHSHRSQSTAALPKLARDVLETLRLYTGFDIDKSADALRIPQNKPRYSEQALQEAVVNALAHRDYESREPTRVTVFSDRIEITNPGGLLPGVDRKRLEEGKAPVHWRNPALASFLLRMKLAQNRGEGIPTILEKTEAVAGRKPQIIAEEAFFTVVLPAYQRSPMDSGPISEPQEPQETDDRPPPQPPRSGYSPYWYVPRPDAEREAANRLAQPGTPVVLVGPDGIGKTYFLDHLLSTHRQPEDTEILINLDNVARPQREQLDDFLYELAYGIVEQTGVKGEILAEAWRRHRPPAWKLTRFLETAVLSQAEGRVLFALDKTDVLLTTRHAEAILSILRSWAESGTKGDPWDRLRLLLVVSTEPSLIAETIHISPFNLADPIRLGDLDADQVAEMGRRYGLEWGSAEIDQLRDIVGGHPYLVRRVMYQAVVSGRSLTELLADPIDDQGIFAGHLRARLLRIRSNEELGQTVRQILDDPRSQVDDATSLRLVRAGVLRRKEKKHYPSYKLYDLYLREWL